MSAPATTTRQSIDAFWTKFLTLVKKRGARENVQRWCVPCAEGFAKAMQPRRLAELTPADIDGYLAAQESRADRSVKFSDSISSHLSVRAAKTRGLPSNLQVASATTPSTMGTFALP
jgi:hypothetical protein